MRALMGLACMLLAAAVAAALCFDRIAVLSADRTPLATQLESALSRWAAEASGGEGRVLSIVLSDGNPSDPLALPAPPPRDPGPLARLKDRLLGPLGGSRHSGGYAFTLVMGDIPDLIDWTYRGRIRGGEAAAAAELGRVLAGASRTGARIRILTHGYAASVALKAISAEPSVQVERLVAAAVDLSHLKEYDPVFFSAYPCPRNLKEWVTVRGEGPGGSAVLSEIFSPGEAEPRRARRELASVDFQASLLAVRALNEKASPAPAPAPARAPGPPARPAGQRPSSPPAIIPPAKGFASKGGSMLILKEAGSPVPAEPARPRQEPSSGDRIRLGDFGWSVLPPAGWQQLFTGRDAPGRVSSIFWTRPKADGASSFATETRIWLDYGLLQWDPGLARACGDLRVPGTRAQHHGYPVEVCAKENVTEDQGRSFGAAYFTLFQGGFAVRIRYDYPTGQRQKEWAVFEGICDSLSRD